MRSDGFSVRTPNNVAGGIFPRGTTGVIYQDGIVWGGKAYTDVGKTSPAPVQLVRVGGGTYTVGTKAGRITGSGASAVATDTSAPEVRVYRVRRDYTKMTDDELRRDAAETFEIPLSNVSASQKAFIQNQYALDWQQWPVQLGAPFIDRNGNGVYDPPPAFSSTFSPESLITQGRDEPGISGANLKFPADQVLWTVYNDLDTAATRSFAGSDPLGLEVQVTVWAYKASSLQNTVFRKAKIINKGGVDVGSGAKGSYWIDSMYVAQWSDPDVGNATDDLVGCDTVLSLGYAYNANNTDSQFQNFSLPPPAIGYDFLQGPIVPSAADTAVFDLKKRFGFKNLGMTAFSYFSTGGMYSDPPWGSYNLSTYRWYQMMRGFAPLGAFGDPDQPYLTPPVFSATKFPLSGDPVLNQGFLDGWGANYSPPPGDRRIFLATGPFSLAPGDTQEVVVANVGGMGWNRLSSIQAMRANDVAAQSMYNTLFAIPMPVTTADVSYPNGTKASVKITCSAQGSPIATIQAILKRQDGSTLSTMTLYDNGTNGDLTPGDGVFANTVVFDRERGGLSLDLVLTDPYGGVYPFDHTVNLITTAGPLEVASPVVFSDNINNNLKLNPGEDIRFGFSVRNSTAFVLQKLSIGTSDPASTGRLRLLDQLNINSTFTLSYNSGEPNSYFELVVPGNYTDTLYNVEIVVMDTLSNQWRSNFTFRVYPFFAPIINPSLPKTAGTATGSFEIMVVDTSQIRNHLYVIHGMDSVDAARTPGFLLKDSTDGRVLISSSPLPDPSGHGVPITDGFKILRGTLTDPSQAGMESWSIPQGTRKWSWQNGNSLGFEGFGGAMGWREPAVHFAVKSTKNLKYWQLRKTLIKFAGTDVNGTVTNSADPDFSYGYRYLRRASDAPAKPAFAPFIINPTTGYPYQDYTKSVPFSAWDVDSDPPRRLMVGYMENNVGGGMVDGRYWPPASTDGVDNNGANGPREWFFIFNTAYSETPDTNLTKDILNTSMPVMWWGTPTREGSVAFETNDEFLIEARHIISWQDMWTFNPTTSTPAPGLNSPPNNATNQVITPTLIWSPSSGALSYDLQVSPNSSFTELTYSDSLIAGNQRPALNLNGTTIYYWRVRARSAVGVSPWSQVWSFTTRSDGLPPVNGTQWLYTRMLSSTKPFGGVRDLVVDPEGKIWVASKAIPVDSVLVGEQYVRMRAIYIFNRNGTQALFSPIKMITVGGAADTLRYDTPVSGALYGAMMAKDNDGNILYSWDDVLYRLNYRTGQGMAKSTPRAHCPISTAAADSSGNIFISYTTSPNPSHILDKNFNIIGTFDLSRTFGRLAVSKDGKNIYAPQGKVTLKLHSDQGVGGAYSVVDSVYFGLAAGTMTWHPKTGYLWTSSGNRGNPPNAPFTRFTWYAMNAATKQIADTIGWNSAFSNDYGNPSGIDFSPSGDTAYVGRQVGLPIDTGLVQVFVRAKPFISPPASWAFRGVTGKMAVIAVPEAINPRIGTQALRTGDAVGVFFSRNDSLTCAGYSLWQSGQNSAITAWGDDDQTGLKDGLADGELIQFKLWDGQLGRDFPALVSYQSGTPTFSTSGIYVLNSLIGNTSITHRISLPQGWNMISSVVAPKDTLLDTLCTCIRSRLVIMKNGRGQVFWPAYSVNTIGAWKIHQGYQVYMLSADTLAMAGEELDPELNPLSVAQGWNMVSYLRNTAMKAELALVSLDTNLVIAKNNSGQVYWPAFGIKNITMKPGQGYQLYMKSARTLAYPVNPGPAPFTFLTKKVAVAANGTDNEPQHYKLESKETGRNAVLGIQCTNLNDGDEIGVWAKRKLVGSGMVSKGRALATVWGDDEITKDVVEGAAEEEQLMLTVWQKSEGREKPIGVLSLVNGLTGEGMSGALRYRTDAALIVTTTESSLIPDEFFLSQNYPNPFNPTTTIQYGLPKDVRVKLEIYNIIGQRVGSLVDTDQKAGYYRVVFQNTRLSSGVYFYSMVAGDFRSTKKFILLK